MRKIILDIQKLTKEKYERPHKSQFQRWIQNVLEVLESDSSLHARIPKIESFQLTLKIVDEVESAKLNAFARKKSEPTNVLSFPCESPEREMINYLGDMAMCGPIIYKEAQQYHIEYKEYWANIFIHGCVHLFGFDHNNAENAEEMESIEGLAMEKSGFAHPYSNNN